MTHRLSWDDVQFFTDELARKVTESGWMPDAIVAVPRGGLTPAHLIAQRLNIRRVAALDVGFADEQRTEIVEYSIPAFRSPAPRRVLLVEDAVDTGRLVRQAYGLLAYADEYDPTGCATVDVRTAAMLRAGQCEPDYVVDAVAGIPSMPWERD